MNKRKEPYSSPNDRDIGALFEAQNINLPRDLDEQILAEARFAVEGDNTQGFMDGSRFRPWFAAAAVAMIAIGLIPQLLQSPESSLQNPESSLISLLDTGSKPAKAQTRTESIRLAEEIPALSEAPVSQKAAARKVASKPALEENVAGGAAGDADVEIELELVNSASSTTTSLTAFDPNDFQPDKLSLSSFANFSSAKQPSRLVYRLDPEDWIEEMQRLESLNMTSAAKLEYRLFRLKYPAFKTTYQPQMPVTKTTQKE